MTAFKLFSYNFENNKVLKTHRHVVCTVAKQLPKKNLTIITDNNNWRNALV